MITLSQNPEISIQKGILKYSQCSIIDMSDKTDSPLEIEDIVLGAGDRIVGMDYDTGGKIEIEFVDVKSISYNTPYTLTFLYQKSYLGDKRSEKLNYELSKYLELKARKIDIESLSALFKSDKERELFLRMYSYLFNNSDQLTDFMRSYHPDAAAFSEILPHVDFKFKRELDGDVIGEYIDLASKNTAILRCLNSIN